MAHQGPLSENTQPCRWPRECRTSSNESQKRDCQLEIWTQKKTQRNNGKIFVCKRHTSHRGLNAFACNCDKSSALPPWKKKGRRQNKGRQTQKPRNHEKVDQNRSYLLESSFIEIMTKPIRTKSYPLQSNFMKRDICGRVSLNQNKNNQTATQQLKLNCSRTARLVAILGLRWPRASRPRFGEKDGQSVSIWRFWTSWANFWCFLGVWYWRRTLHLFLVHHHVVFDFFAQPTVQVTSCGFGLVVWVFLTLYFDQRKPQKQGRPKQHLDP